MGKITIYATTENGKGFTESIGTVENLEEITIRCGMFASDVVITFEEEFIETPSNDD